MFIICLDIRVAQSGGSCLKEQARQASLHTRVLAVHPLPCPHLWLTLNKNTRAAACLLLHYYCNINANNIHHNDNDADENWDQFNVLKYNNNTYDKKQYL